MLTPLLNVLDGDGFNMISCWLLNMFNLVVAYAAMAITWFALDSYQSWYVMVKTG